MSAGSTRSAAARFSRRCATTLPAQLGQRAELVGQRLVPGLLHAADPQVDQDPRLAALVGELSRKSEEFGQLWARHDVRGPVGRFSLIRHPAVGDLDLFADKLGVAGTDGLVFSVYHAEPGSESARSLALLGSLAASA